MLRIGMLKGQENQRDMSGQEERLLVHPHNQVELPENLEVVENDGSATDFNDAREDVAVNTQGRRFGEIDLQHVPGPAGASNRVF